MDNTIPTTAKELNKIWSSKTLDNGTLMLTAYKGTATNVFVPDHIGKKKVTVIGEFAFYPNRGRLKNANVRKEVTAVHIPEGIEKIGYRAFQGCNNLVGVDMPSTLKTIEGYAFYGCKALSSITIYEGVIEIGTSAFANCSNLTSICVVDENTNFSSYDGVLFSKDNNRIIQYPAGKKK